MTDKISRERRSRNMAAIRSRGNATTEGRMAAILRSRHIVGWRRHSNLQGKPDFTFRKQRVVVFTHGCFWHGCPRCYRAPGDNASYWADKVARNRARDRRVQRQLRAAGWSVLVFWEHALRSETAVVRRLTRAMSDGGQRDG